MSGEESSPSKLRRLESPEARQIHLQEIVDDLERQRQEIMDPLGSLQLKQRKKQAENCVKQIINQLPFNERYSSSNPLKVTIVASDWDTWEWRWGGTTFTRLTTELSRQLANFPQVKVSFLVPEGSCDDDDKRNAEFHNVTIVEAKKQPRIKDPLEWLYFPVEGLATDIVIGVGGRLGKVAEIFKRFQHCKSICFMKDQYEELNHELRDLSCALAEKKKEKLELRHRSNGDGSLYADLSVAIGQKMYKQHRRSKKTRVVPFIPGILSKFDDTDNRTETLTADDDSGEFCILVEGGEDPECFEYEELHTVAKAVAHLNDRSCKLVYIGAAEYGDKRFVEKFCQYGVPEKQVQIRQHPTMEELKSWFCEADLVILPSSEQMFGMMGLAALSSGLPVLVHGESGFGEALKAVKFGDTATVDSEDATEWAQKIKKLRKISRQLRREQASELRSFYNEKYSWGKQLGALVKEMFSMMSAQ